MNGLEVAELTQPSFFQRLFRRKPRENAFITIQNIVASTPITQVTHESIAAILADYRLSLEDIAEDAKSLYGSVLRNYVSDRTITDEEMKDLLHLKLLLGLNDTDIAAVEEESKVAIYQEEVQVALADSRVNEEDMDRLSTIAAGLRMPDDHAKRLLARDATALYEKAIAKAVDDRRLTPDEEGELQRLRGQLGISIVHDDPTESHLARCRLLWKVEQGDLPAIATQVNLQKNEICHGWIDATLFEVRTRTRRVRYGGPTARIRIAKGIYYRVGDVAFSPVTETYHADLGTGRLYITSKRLLFDGSLRNIAIPLSKILDYSIYSDGLVIEKDTGKDQFFKCSGDLELVAAILGGAITAAKAGSTGSRGRGLKS